MSLTRKKNANEKNGERHELGIEVEGRLRGTSDSVRHSTYMLAVEEKFICRLDAMHSPTHNSVNPIVYCIMGLVSRGPFRARAFENPRPGIPFFFFHSFPFIIHVHVLVYVWSSDDICIRIGGHSDASASGCKEERSLAGGGPADVDPDAKRRTGGSLAPMPTTTATRRLA